MDVLTNDMKERVVLEKRTQLVEMIDQFDLVKQLSPTLSIEQYHVYLEQMIPHNYFQVVASLNDEIVGLSGYWIGTKLYCGRYLEIDNFIIEEKYRSNGIGNIIIEWLTREAHENKCSVLMLDAYVENFKAHSFYYRHGFIGRGFHFIKKI